MFRKSKPHSTPDFLYTYMLEDKHGLSMAFENWKDIYTAFEKNKMITLRTKSGLSLYTDKAGIFAMWKIFVRDFYTRHFSVEKGDVVVDIGAHHGLFACFAARKAAHIHCYEPAPGNVAVLRKNLKVNGITNVTIYEKAITGGDEARIKLGLSGDSATHSRFLAGDKASLGTIEVGAVSLGDIVRDVGKIDFLKLHCEGCEFDVIMSADDRDLSKVRKVAIIYTVSGTNKPEDMVEKLKGTGMKTFHSTLSRFPFRGVNVKIGLITGQRA